MEGEGFDATSMIILIALSVHRIARCRSLGNQDEVALY